MKNTERTLECTAAQGANSIPDEIVIITLFQFIDLVREEVTVVEGADNNSDN